MAHSDPLRDIEKYAERRLGRFMDEINKRFESEVQRRLDDWARRYPRHRFEAYQGHGMLVVNVSPPLGSDKYKGRKWTNIDNLPGHMCRGAIADIHEEVRELIEAHVRLEWSVGTGDFGPLSSTRPERGSEEEMSSDMPRFR